MNNETANTEMEDGNGEVEAAAAAQRAQEEVENQEAARVACGAAGQAHGCGRGRGRVVLYTVADEREVQRLSQLPRAVVAFWKPAAILRGGRTRGRRRRQRRRCCARRRRESMGWSMPFGLRPSAAGQRLWQAYQAVRPRAHRDMGMFNKKGPFPNEVLEIQIGTARSCVGAIMNNKKDLTPIIMEAVGVAAMEAGAAGGACGRLSFELELARLDFANHNGRTASWARACRSRIWRTCSTRSRAVCSISRWCGRRLEQHDLTTRVKIEVTYNSTSSACTIPE